MRQAKKVKAPKLLPAHQEASRHDLIAKEAYLLAEKRGFCCGGELEDWLRAEAKIDAARSQAQA